MRECPLDADAAFARENRVAGIDDRVAGVLDMRGVRREYYTVKLVQ